MEKRKLRFLGSSDVIQVPRSRSWFSIKGISTDQPFNSFVLSVFCVCLCLLLFKLKVLSETTI